MRRRDNVWFVRVYEERREVTRNVKSERSTPA
jgi:hypothetical protein